MGLIPNQRHQLAVVELDRRAPQTAHFQQLVQERGEGSYEPEQQPRRGRILMSGWPTVRPMALAISILGSIRYPPK